MKTLRASLTNRMPQGCGKMCGRRIQVLQSRLKSFIGLQKALVVVSLGLVLLSCASTPERLSPPVELGETFSKDGSAALPEKWWEAFEEPELNSLIERALSNNFSLQAAWDRLDQAWATAAKSGAGLWPSAEASGGFARSVSRTKGLPRIYANLYSLGLAASYELDLWGRVRSTREASRLSAYASEQDLHAAAITLSAEVALAWFQLIEQQGQLRLIDAQLKTNRDYLKVVTLKFRRGQSSATDVLQQQQLVEANTGERGLVEAKIEVLKHQLAILLGEAPGRYAVDAPESLPDLPTFPQTGLQADWLRRRPDLRAAELRVLTADESAAAALADRFPKLSLGVAADTSAAKIRDLFDNWAATFAANLVAPLIDGNSRKAELDRSRAAAREQLNSYAQVLLSSLKEVEDALVQEAKQAECVESLGRQLRLSEKATQQTRENYTKGGTDFTRYLTTLQSHQALQRSHLKAVRERLDYRVGLYRSLAGGWELERTGSADNGQSNHEGNSTANDS